MRTAKEIKEDLIAALASSSDQNFDAMGFKRNKRALKYVRTVGDAKQTISFAADYLPRYRPGEEIHIHPHMHLEMKAATEAALQLVAGDKMLLANAPEIIVNQPIEFTAPKTEDHLWFANGLDQMKKRVIEISRFVQVWVSPFFDELTTPDELIQVYKSADDRMMKQRHWYLFIAAAYLEKGDDRKALGVLEDNLGKPGLRKRYAVAFETLCSP